MKNSLTLLIGIALALILLSKMFLYQVRYDQTAVRTTFNQASDSSVVDEPGLKFRLPWPVDRVEHFSNQIQLLESKLAEVPTRDGKTVIIKNYLSWRIDNPLAFFKTLRTTREAEKQLGERLQAMASIIGQYNFDQLVNTDPAKLRLEEIEAKTAQELQAALDRTGYGVQVHGVGIRKIVLPKPVTEKVFDTMVKTRERLAENARQEGQAQATTIRSAAQSARDRMLAFAESRAQAIRSVGDQEAVKIYADFAQTPDGEAFAIFLRQLETLKKTLEFNTTLVMDAQGLFNLLKEVPTLAAPVNVQTPMPVTPLPATPGEQAGAQAAVELEQGR